MKRIIYLLVFVLVVFFVGTYIISNTLFKRNENYYVGEAKGRYIENDQAGYLDAKFLLLSVTEYLNEPLYQFNVESGNTAFDFNINHYRRVENNEVSYFLNFEIFNLISSEEITNLKVGFYNDDFSDQFYIIQNIDLSDITNPSNWISYDIQILDNNGKFVLSFPNSSASLNQLTRIQISNGDNILLTINSNNSETLSLGNVVSVIGNETNNFTGDLAKYNRIKDLYDNEENVLIPDISGLGEYNSVVTRNLTLYVIASLALLFLFFIRKPLTDYFKTRKMQKQLTKKQ